MTTKEKTVSNFESVVASDTSTVDLIKLTRVFIDNRWMVLIAVLASVMATIMLTFAVPPTYRSIATISARGAGKLWIDENKNKLFWQNEKPVHDVAKREKIDLEGGAVTAVANYEQSGDTARVVIDVVAAKPGTSKRLAESLADHFVKRANTLSGRAHELNAGEEKIRFELALQRKRLNQTREKRKNLSEDAAVLREAVRGLDAASRKAPTGLILNSQSRGVINSLIDIDNSLISQELAIENMKLNLKEAVSARVLDVGEISDPQKMEKRPLFNAIVAGIVAAVITGFLLYFRERRISESKKLSSTKSDSAIG